MAIAEIVVNGKPIDYKAMTEVLVKSDLECKALSFGRNMQSTLNPEIWTTVDPKIEKALQSAQNFEEAISVFESSVYGEPGAERALFVCLQKATTVEQIAKVANFAKYELFKDLEKQALLTLASRL